MTCDSAFNQTQIIGVSWPSFTPTFQLDVRLYKNGMDIDIRQPSAFVVVGY